MDDSGLSVRSINPSLEPPNRNEERRRMAAQPAHEIEYLTRIAGDTGDKGLDRPKCRQDVGEELDRLRHYRHGDSRGEHHQIDQLAQGDALDGVRGEGSEHESDGRSAQCSDGDCPKLYPRRNRHETDDGERPGLRPSRPKRVVWILMRDELWIRTRNHQSDSNRPGYVG